MINRPLVEWIIAGAAIFIIAFLVNPADAPTRNDALWNAASAASAEQAAVGENIVGTVQGKGSKKILLMAHMDTVYVKGTLAKAPFRIDGVRAFGPGIADAKGGVANVKVNIMANVRHLDPADIDNMAKLLTERANA